MKDASARTGSPEDTTGLPLDAHVRTALAQLDAGGALDRALLDERRHALDV